MTDTGVGIPPEKQRAVFEPFTQADGSTTRRYGGTGLGLTVSAQLVALMGGRLAVESAAGRGSTFHFTAPFAVGQTSAPGTVFRPAGPARPLRVLLAEDNPINSMIAVRLLEKEGHAVAVAGNGREAVEAAAAGAFDLVLMDVEMPEVDGFEATARLRAREAAGARLPVIGLTAHALKGDRERCLAAGMDGYVPKPISPDDLFREIDEVMAAAGAGARGA